MTRKQIKEKAAQFRKFVEWSDEEQCFVGICPELFGGGINGKEETKVYAELCKLVEKWVVLLDRREQKLSSQRTPIIC
ncbi:MAG: hypothetical protein WDN00_12740 [Limisphaerales bacterium]